MTRTALALLALAACADAPPEITPVGDAPTDAPPPAALLLHGTGDTGERISARWGVDALAPTSPAGQWTAEDVPDLAALVEAQLEPEQRAIVMGQGTGGALAWALACARSDVFAVAVVLGSAVDPAVPCPNVVSILHVHGTVDDVVPYLSTRDAVDRAFEIARCDTPAHMTAPDLGATVEAIGCRYYHGRRLYGAEHWRVIGWGHNPDLTPAWSDAVTAWATERAQ